MRFIHSIKLYFWKGQGSAGMLSNGIASMTMKNCGTAAQNIVAEKIPGGGGGFPLRQRRSALIYRRPTILMLFMDVTANAGVSFCFCPIFIRRFVGLAYMDGRAG
jgi:hypothetical protein